MDKVLYSISVTKDSGVRITELEYFEEMCVGTHIKGYRMKYEPYRRHYRVTPDKFNIYYNGRVICREIDIPAAIRTLYEHNVKKLKQEEILVEDRKAKLKHIIELQPEEVVAMVFSNNQAD